MDNVIDVQNLTKKYKNLIAVDKVSFSVPQGQLFGFLGPNGAGKTTTISMLVTILKPTSGTAKIGGYDIIQNKDAVRSSIGIVFQDPSLDERLTAWENLRFHAMLYNINVLDFKNRAQSLLKIVKLFEKRHLIVKTFSGGMKRRLEIVRGLIHTPKVLFLDEPTIGLDPQTRAGIWDYVLNLRTKHNITIFLTTHYMDEAEYCDEIAIMDNGKIIAKDSPNNLKKFVGGDVVSIQTNDNQEFLKHLDKRYQIKGRINDNIVYFEVNEGHKFVPQLIQNMPNQIISVNIRRPTLNDVFLKLTGREIRNETADPKSRLRQSFGGHGR